MAESFTKLKPPLSLAGASEVGELRADPATGEPHYFDGAQLRSLLSSLTAQELLDLLKTVDGAGSGLDADTLAGVGLDFLVQGGSALRTAAVTDLNVELAAGFYSGEAVANAPTSNPIAVLICRNLTPGQNAQYQWVFDFNAVNRIWVRRYASYAVDPWQEIYHPGNLTPAELLAQIKTVDGAGSGLDADSVDGIGENQIVYGEAPSRTLSADAGLIGWPSGFFDSSAAADQFAPVWQHTIISRHRNVTTDYSLQIGGDFFSDDLRFRRVAASIGSSWQKIYHEGMETGWFAPTFENGWQQVDATDHKVLYRKDADNMVHLRGLVSGGAYNTRAFILPAGYRPGNLLIFGPATNVSNLPARVDIYETGSVYIIYGSAWVSLAGIAFKAEN